jgi:hypothetical protein
MSQFNNIFKWEEEHTEHLRFKINFLEDFKELCSVDEKKIEITDKELLEFYESPISDFDLLQPGKFNNYFGNSSSRPVRRLFQKMWELAKREN